MTKRAGGVNRYSLVKSYYMALSALTDRDGNGMTGNYTPEKMLQDGYYKRTSEGNFTRMANYSPELKNALIDSKITDIDFINLVAKVTAAGNPEDEEHNQILAQNWTKFYEILKK